MVRQALPLPRLVPVSRALVPAQRVVGTFAASSVGAPAHSGQVAEQAINTTVQVTSSASILPGQLLSSSIRKPASGFTLVLSDLPLGTIPEQVGPPESSQSITASE